EFLALSKREDGRNMHHKIREYLPNGNKTAGRNSIYLTTKYISYRTLMEEKHTKKDTAYHMKKERNNGRKASSEMLMIPSADADLDSRGRREFGRRSFLKGLGMAGATLLPASALL